MREDQCEKRSPDSDKEGTRRMNKSVTGREIKGERMNEGKRKSDREILKKKKIDRIKKIDIEKEKDR